MTRGQTTLDFAIGMSVFLIVVTFVLAFVPGMLQPFEASTQQKTTVADRVAEQVVSGMLPADVRTPYVLDRECTVVFFEDESADAGDPDIGENTDGDGDFSAVYDDGTFTGTCDFEDLPVLERMGIDQPGLNMRIRLERDLKNGPTSDSDETIDTLCLDANSDAIVEAGDPVTDDDGNDCDIDEDDDDVVFAIGETPPTSVGSVVVARRVVYVEGGFADGTADATLVVEVW